MQRFVAECDAHGVHLKWFGAPQPAGFTSRHVHWRYVAGTPQVPDADRVLAGLCDMRIALGMTDTDCDTVAAVLAESMHAALTGPA